MRKKDAVNLWIDNVFIPEWAPQSSLQVGTRRSELVGGNSRMTHKATLVSLLHSMDSSSARFPGVMGLPVNGDDQYLLASALETAAEESGVNTEDLLTEIRRKRSTTPKVDVHSALAVLVENISNSEVVEILRELADTVYADPLYSNDLTELDSCFHRDSQLPVAQKNSYMAAVGKVGASAEVSLPKRIRYMCWGMGEGYCYPELTEGKVRVLQKHVGVLIEELLESMEVSDGFWRTLKKVLCIRLFLKYTAFLSSYLAFHKEELPSNNMLQFLAQHHTGISIPPPQDYADILSTSINSSPGSSFTCRAQKYQSTALTPVSMEYLAFPKIINYPTVSSHIRQEVACLTTLICRKWYGLKTRDSEESLEELCQGKHTWWMHSRPTSSEYNQVCYAGESGVRVPWSNFDSRGPDPGAKDDPRFYFGDIPLVSNTDSTKLLNRVLSRIVKKSPLLGFEVDHLEVTPVTANRVVDGFIGTLFNTEDQDYSNHLLEYAAGMYAVFLTTGNTGGEWVTGIPSSIARRVTDQAYFANRYPYGEIPRYVDARSIASSLSLDGGGLVTTGAIQVLVDSLHSYLCFRATEPAFMEGRKKILAMSTSDYARTALLLGELVTLCKDWELAMAGKHVHVVSASIQTSASSMDGFNPQGPYPGLTQQSAGVTHGDSYTDPVFTHTEDNLLGSVGAPYAITSGLADPTLSDVPFARASLAYSAVPGVLPGELEGMPPVLPRGPYLSNIADTTNVTSPWKDEPREEGFDIRFLYHPVLQETMYRRVSEAVEIAHEAYKTIEKMRC